MLVELLEKIGRGQNLNALELSQLRDEARALEEVKNLAKGWVTPGTSMPIFVPPMSVIYSQVLAADTASLTITIPNGYKHLMFLGSGRINGTGGQNFAFTKCQFNGDTTATNYQYGHVFQTSGTEGASEDLSEPSTLFWMFVADGEATNSFVGSAVIFAPHYRSNWYKTLVALGGVSLSAGTSSAARIGLWKSVSPIESVTIFPDPTYAGAKIVAGTLISVYGIL